MANAFDKPHAALGPWHHRMAKVAGNRVQLVVHDKPALGCLAPKAVTSANVAGIIAWSEAEFDDLRLFALRRPERGRRA